MRYDLPSKGKLARLCNYGGHLAEVSNRRHIPGGIVVDVRLVDTEGKRTGVRSWTEAESNVEYIDG